jgi:hypothetical protein
MVASERDRKLGPLRIKLDSGLSDPAQLRQCRKVYLFEPSPLVGEGREGVYDRSPTVENCHRPPLCLSPTSGERTLGHRTRQHQCGMIENGFQTLKRIPVLKRGSRWQSA